MHAHVVVNDGFDMRIIVQEAIGNYWDCKLTLQPLVVRKPCIDYHEAVSRHEVCTLLSEPAGSS